jgi:glycerol-3-phosphate acyltransferase PlsY
MFDLGIRLIVAYLIGSLLGALVVGRLSGAGDIRAEGSGNAGGTNALRTRGPAFALAVVVVDVGKGTVAATLVAHTPLPWAPAPVDGTVVALCCAAASVLGHVFPYWYDFRGGKGAATLVGAYAALAPVLLAPVLATWLLCLTLTGFVGLSTVVAGAAAALVALALQPGDAPAALVGFAVAMAMLLVYTHRANVQRMVRGVEDRKHAVMLLPRLRGRR